MCIPRRFGRWSVVLAGVLGAAVACQAIAPLAFDIGRSLLQGVAQNNYQVDYQKMFVQMMDTLSGHAQLKMQSMRMEAVAAEEQAEEEEESAETSSETPSETPSHSSSASVATVEPAHASSSAAATPAPQSPLQLDVAVLREASVEGSLAPVLVNDGDVLRDGTGRETTGDNLKIRFRASQGCYVYAVWVDATAWATPIFPMGPAGSFPNPVDGGRDYTLPEGKDWYYLDDYRGIESLYFIASREPLADLDTVLRELSGRTRPEQSTSGAALATLSQPEPITRGLAGTRPGRTTGLLTSDGASHVAPSQSFISEISAGDLVVTRWFRHE